jgi:hypothetical protein
MESPSTGYAAQSRHADWPFGEYYRKHEDLAAHLHQVGRRHARRALLLYTSQDEFDQLDAAYSVGSSVELLAKSLLAFVDPALLIPRDADATTILKYSGTKISGVEYPDAFAIRSLEASRALDRLKQIKLLPPLWVIGDHSVLSVRNAAAHMGVVHQDMLRSAIRPMVRFAEHVRLHHRATALSWWGKELSKVAPEMVEADALEWQQVVRAKIAAARVRVAELQASLPATAANGILSSMEGYWRTHIDHNEKMKCPACGFNGWAAGEADRGAGETDYDESGPTYWSTLHVLHFECNVCGLELTDEVEVSLAGLEIDIEFQDEEYAPEPDY